MAGWQEVTKARSAREPHSVRRRAPGAAIAASIAKTVLAIAAFAPPGALAADRYALGSGAIVRYGQSVPATAPTLEADRFVLHGGVSRGQADSIFADGFDLNPSFDVAFASNIPLDAELIELGSIEVPAGSYAVFVRLQARTGDDPNPGNSYRLDCHLSPAGDDGVYRVGVEPSVERYLNYQGAVELDSAGTIRFLCRSANEHEAMAVSGKLTAVAVGGVD